MIDSKSVQQSRVRLRRLAKIKRKFFLPLVVLRSDAGSWPPLRGFAITLRYTTVGRTPLDE
jgi:hypothetical protein